MSLLEIRDLAVHFRSSEGTVEAVRGVSLNVSAGETVAVVGESGSGKTTLGLGLLKLVGSTGTVTFDGRDLRALRGGELRGLRSGPPGRVSGPLQLLVAAPERV